MERESHSTIVVIVFCHSRPAERVANSPAFEDQRDTGAAQRSKENRYSQISQFFHQNQHLADTRKLVARDLGLPRKPPALTHKFQITAR
jgi:hypothetical protein